jgi:hypothetical protein
MFGYFIGKNGAIGAEIITSGGVSSNETGLLVLKERAPELLGKGYDKEKREVFEIERDKDEKPVLEKAKVKKKAAAIAEKLTLAGGK